MLETQKLTQLLKKYRLFYDLFNSFPLPVFLFKNGSLIYTNKIFRELLTIENIQDRAYRLELIGKILDVDLPEEASLQTYLLDKNILQYKEKIFQVLPMKFGPLQLFVFSRIEAETIRHVLDNRGFYETLSAPELYEAMNSPEEIEDATIRTFATDFLGRQVKVLSFYMGLPLKSPCKVVYISADKVILQVEDKQIINFKENTEFTIIINEKKSFPNIIGYAEQTDHASRLLHLNQLRPTAKTPLNRHNLRLKPRPADQLKITLDHHDYLIYDISETHICFISDYDPKLEETALYEVTYEIILKEEKKLISTGCLLFKTTPFGERFKTILRFSEKTPGKWRLNYLQERQVEIIQGIHDYILRFRGNQKES